MSLGSFWPEFTYIQTLWIVSTCAWSLYDAPEQTWNEQRPRDESPPLSLRSVCPSGCLSNTSSLKQMRDEPYTKRRRAKCEIKLSKWKPTLTIFISLYASLCRSASLSLCLCFFHSASSHEYCLKTSIIHLLCLHIECPQHEISSSLILRTRLRLQLQLSRLQPPPPLGFPPESSLRCVLNLERGFVHDAYAN